MLMFIVDQRVSINQLLQEEADVISIEQGAKFVPRVLLSNVASGKKKTKKPKKIKRKKK